MKPHLRDSGSRATILALVLGLGFGNSSADLEASAADTAHSTSLGPQLSVPATVHDFGTVTQGRTLAFNWPIANVGVAPLLISDVKPSCGCTTTGEWPHVLTPGQSGTIPIRLETAELLGAITKTVLVRSNDPVQPEQVLEMRATIWTPISISNSIVIFPAAADPTQSTTRTITLRHEQEGPLTLSDLRCDNPAFKTALREVVPGREFELAITTVPPLPEGTQHATIRLKSSNAKMPEVDLQAVVTLLPAVQVAPSEFKFVASNLGTPEKRYAVLLNHRGFDLKVSDLSCDVPGVQWSTTTSPDGRQCTITLTFPTGFRVANGTKYSFRGRTNHPNMSTFTIPIVAAGSL